jgi:hypothetical protein
MTWNTDANVQAEAAKEHALVVLAASLVFPSGTVRLTNYTAELSIGGNTFIPGYNAEGGLLVFVKEPVERAELYAERWTYQLAGVDPSVLPESEIDISYGGAVIEYEVWLDPATRTMVGYEVRREGSISKVRRRDGDEPLIEVDCEHRLVVLEEADGLRYTDEHQQQYFFSGDLGCAFTRELDSVEVIWNGKRIDPGDGPYYRQRVPR